MKTNSFDATCFKTLAEEASGLVDRSTSLRAEATRARERIQRAVSLLETLDLERAMTGMRRFAEIARNSAAA